MTLESALINALSQDWPVTGTESDQDLVRDLVLAYGSQAAVAAELHVPKGRVQAWLKGRKPAGEVDRLRLLAATRLERLPEGMDDSKIVLEGTDHHGRPCKPSAKALKIRPGTLDSVVDAYVAGDYPGAVDALVAGIGDSWYHRQYAIGVRKERAGSSHPIHHRGGEQR